MEDDELRKFMNEITQLSMKEFWDNEEDNIWEDFLKE